MECSSRFTLLLTLWVPVGLLGQVSEPSVQSFTLASGPFGVGFTTVVVIDSTRYSDADPVVEPGPREIVALVWYPAKTVPAGRQMVFGEYVELDALKLGLRSITDNWRFVVANRLLQNHGQFGLTRARLEREWASPTWAVRDAERAAGRFPVVLYSPGGGNPAWDNSVLAEYLASHGYVVASIPARGWYSSRLSYPTHVVGSMAMAADLQAVRQRISTWPSVDPGRVAVMGFSRGGLTNVLMQMRDASIGALVGLDGTIAYRYRHDPNPWTDPEKIPGSLEATGFGQPSRVDVPFLWIGSRHPRQQREEWGIDPYFLFWDELRYSTAYRVEFLELQHQDFSSAAIRMQPDVAEIGPPRAQEVKNRWYEATALYVGQFLDAYLKDDPSATAFLARRPEENGLDPGAVEVARRTPVGPAPTLSALRRTLEQQGFGVADSVVREIVAIDPEWTLPEPDLVNWGWTLLAEERCRDALAVLQAARRLHPGSSAVAETLGEAYLALGDRDAARRAYAEATHPAVETSLATSRLLELGTGGSMEAVVRCSM